MNPRGKSRDKERVFGRDAATGEEGGGLTELGCRVGGRVLGWKDKALEVIG